jgi:hypothetical protein
MRLHRLGLIPLNLLFVGCFAGRMRSLTQSWEGRQSSELIARLGQPQAILKDPDGGTILVYVRDKQWSTVGQLTTTTIPNVTMTDNGLVDHPITYPEFTPGQTFHVTEIVTFRVDGQGRITDSSKETR